MSKSTNIMKRKNPKTCPSPPPQIQQQCYNMTSSAPQVKVTIKSAKHELKHAHLFLMPMLCMKNELKIFFCKFHSIETYSLSTKKAHATQANAHEN